MKLIKYTILTLFIMIPVLIINTINSRISLKAQQTKILYENIIMNAAQDGAEALKDNTIVDIKYGKEKEITTNTYEVMTTFLSSLYYGFGVVGELDKINIESYLPAVIIIDYDGYYVYSAQEYIGLIGDKEIRHVLSPKKYYSYINSNLMINFTLDKYVEVFDISNNQLYKGSYNSLDILNGVFGEGFDITRRNAIIQTIKKELEICVNRHNKYAKDLGIVYNFQLPIIDSDIWGKTVEDIGLIVCFQGKKIGPNKYLNIFSMKSAEIFKRKIYQGYISAADGKKYYCEDGCNKLNGQVVVKEFMNPLEATKEGFYPCIECKP